MRSEFLLSKHTGIAGLDRSSTQDPPNADWESRFSLSASGS
jgi:hypothetical protein